MKWELKIDNILCEKEIIPENVHNRNTYFMILLNLCVTFFFVATILPLFGRSERGSRKNCKNKRNLQESQVGLEDLENLGVPVDRKTVKGTLQNTRDKIIHPFPDY